MNQLHEKCISFRQQGYSYNEINKMLGVPKSTLSSWLSHIVLSKNATLRLSNRVKQGSINGLLKKNKEQTIDAQKRAADIRALACAEIRSLSTNDLLLAGTILYWAEGYKRLKVKNGREITSHVVGLTNSDPTIVSTFVTFLKRILKVPPEKIVIETRLFKHIDEGQAIEYWMGVTGLNKTQFRRPRYDISVASKGIRPINRLPYGTVQVIVSDTKLFYKIMGYIDGIKTKMALIKNI